MKRINFIFLMVFITSCSTVKNTASTKSEDSKTVTMTLKEFRIFLSVSYMTGYNTGVNNVIQKLENDKIDFECLKTTELLKFNNKCDSIIIR